MFFLLYVNTSAFLYTCPEASSSKERRRIGRPPSSWQLNTVEVLDVFRGLDQLSSAMEDKWLAMLNRRNSVERGREMWLSSGGGKEGEVITSGD